MAVSYQLASLLIVSTSSISFNRQPPRVPSNSFSTYSRLRRRHSLKCSSNHSSDDDHETMTIIPRRSANYQPPLWHFDYVQSLSTPFTAEAYGEQIEKLKKEVRVMVKRARDEDDPLSQLELIDVLQRLGISYHFEDQVNGILKDIYNSNNYIYKTNNIYATSLEFRLLRQHGYPVSQEIFSTCKDNIPGNLRAFTHETKGLLSLYEASFYLVEGDDGILEEARHTTKKCLEEYIMMKGQQLEQNDDDSCLYELVSHALELPLHWRMLRLDTRWFIDVYERRPHMNPTLLMLAKLDFNVVQSTYQEELKYAFSWWESTGLGQKLEFARDRMMVNYLWTIGVSFEPHYTSCRRMATKVNALITVIDDIYDVYGTLDELELFTDVVERWDINAMDGLPEYMKTCFLALYNFINDYAFDVLKGKSLHVKKYLQKAWADLCKSYLREAKWYYKGYTPTFEEYIENAWISIAGPVILSHIYIFVANPTKEDALSCLDEYPSIIRHSSIILRLTNDLATSTDELKRGDVPKSIQCHMHELGVSEDEARQYMMLLVNETWKCLNKDYIYDSPFSKAFIEISTNLARMAHCIYQYGDGHGIQDRQTNDHVLSLLIHPIPLGPIGAT
ncbi:terpene synthase 10-like [Humulus lupulus]|uniref:terpene synthase 10-like n=1 Tax=Humulus lupulus TaxID=3486 RepID=UPI002B409874|nr:terpene synthase 10-like [Humulus lupulus]